MNGVGFVVSGTPTPNPEYDAGRPPARKLPREALIEIERRVRREPWSPGCLGHAGCLIAALLGHIAALEADERRRREREAGDRDLARRRTSLST